MHLETPKSQLEWWRDLIFPSAGKPILSYLLAELSRVVGARAQWVPLLDPSFPAASATQALVLSWPYAIDS